MALLYDPHERTVIDDTLLRQSIIQENSRSAYNYSFDPEIDYNSVTHLRLEFKNVMIIENLDHFLKLTKLQLCNNIIISIDGLQSLIQLKWLDLSFNEIHRMEGLSHLVNLQDLCLTHNKIEAIEGIVTLNFLEVLTIGFNLISDLENVMCLRNLKYLRTLRLKGNPVSNEVSYQDYVISRLPQLVYLDFRMISSADRLHANIRYSDEIQTLESLYHEGELNAIENLKHKAHKHLEVSAFVDDFNGSDFYNKLVAEDLQCFLNFPGLLEVSEVFREKILANNRECAIYGIRAHELREAEAQEYLNCVKRLTDENKQLCIHLIDTFKNTNNHFELELTNLLDDIYVNSLLGEMRRGARDLFNLLLKNEMQLVNQIELIFQDFERILNEKILLFLEQIRCYMTECRDLSQRFAEKLNDIAMNTLEEISKGQLETDLPEEILRLLVDKDNLVATLSASHDCHMSTIDKKEDYINVSVSNYASKLLSQFCLVETERNRLRIGEIENLFESFIESIDETEENIDK